jgi:HlyD family secretion protein
MKKMTAVLTATVAVLLFGIIAITLFVVLKDRSAPAPVIMTAMAETAEIDVAAKIPGRIAQVRFGEGAFVKKGDTLAILESRELDAKVGQAQAALRAAKARLTMANTGLRPQEKEGAEKLYLQAKAQADLMEKTWTRVKKLSDDSIVSRQERDQVEAQFVATREAMSAAEAKLSLAREGSRIEDREAAAALVAQAQAACAEVEAWSSERTVTAPVNGEVAKQIMREGEIVGAGAPILTIIDIKDVWIVLTVKETELSPFRMGSPFNARIPALGDTLCPFRVSYLAPMGDFATWRPTSQKGGFDQKTFEVHLRPAQPIDGLRAGMSVNIIR